VLGIRFELIFLYNIRSKTNRSDKHLSSHVRDAQSHVGLRTVTVLLLLSDFNQNWNMSSNFSFDSTSIEFHGNRSAVLDLLNDDGWSEMTNLTGVFLLLFVAEAPKSWYKGFRIDARNFQSELFALPLQAILRTVRNK
jgi:hypothetical protein